MNHYNYMRQLDQDNEFEDDSEYEEYYAGEEEQNNDSEKIKIQLMIWD